MTSPEIETMADRYPMTAVGAQTEPFLSLIVPTLNEGSNLLHLIERVDKALEGRGYEVIVVDDGSTDGTREVAMTASGTYPLVLICRDGERGLGSAVSAGFEQAAGDYLGVMDADLQHPPELLPKMLDSIQNGHDIVVASRYIRGGCSQGLGRRRQIVSWGACTLSRMLLPSARQVRDPMSGFFLLKKRVVEDVEIHPIGYKILLEILAKAKNAKVEEIPYKFSERRGGKSKLQAREYLDFLRLISMLAWRDLEMGRFVRFCVVGVGGVGLSLAVMWLLTTVLGLFYFASALLTSLLAITANFVLNDLWTFRDTPHRGLKALLGRWAKFNVSRWLLFVMGLALLPLLVEVGGLNYLLATVIIIGIQTIVNYGASVVWIWRR